MSDPLKLSHNELSALLKLVFQGMFGHSQDWAALAAYVHWLETHGFEGVSILVQAIETNTLRRFDGAISKTEKGLHIDFNGNSILMGLPLLVDLAIAHSTKRKNCHIVVSSAVQCEAFVAADAAIRDKDPNLFVDPIAMVISTITDNKSPHINLAKANQYYAQSLRDGVPMYQSTYTFLNEIADTTLVESTEASRRGAGE